MRVGAVRHLRKALAVNPTLAPALLHLGIALKALGDARGAVGRPAPRGGAAADAPTRRTRSGSPSWTRGAARRR